MTVSEIKNLIEHYKSELNRLNYQTTVAKNALENLQKQLESKSSKPTKDIDRPPTDPKDDWDE